MLVTRWLPWVNRLEEEVNRVLGDTARTAWPGLAYSYPPVNLWEDKDHLFVEAELPGMELDKIEIFVAEGNQLTIQGERRQDDQAQGTWHRRERGFGKFSRALELPYEVNADKVEARFENGVLRVTLPKSERVKPRRITVKTD